MPEHEWVYEDPDAFDVFRVQPYDAVKAYRCPGCDHEIAAGVGHIVVVPRTARDDRRHWHHGCWHKEERRR